MPERFRGELLTVGRYTIASFLFLSFLSRCPCLSVYRGVRRPSYDNMPSYLVTRDLSVDSFITAYSGCCWRTRLLQYPPFSDVFRGNVGLRGEGQDKSVDVAIIYWQKISWWNAVDGRVWRGVRGTAVLSCHLLTIVYHATSVRRVYVGTRAWFNCALPVELGCAIRLEKFRSSIRYRHSVAIEQYR